MAKKPGRPKAILAPEARRDVIAIRKWTEKTFGKDAEIWYEALLVQALRDIVADPERPGSEDRPDLGTGVRGYHLSLSLKRARTSLGIVHNPRHFVIYRRSPTAIDILRILHDSRDPHVICQGISKSYMPLSDSRYTSALRPGAEEATLLSWAGTSITM